MFKIKGNDFHVTRGDAGSFNITLKDYTFEANQPIILRIYNEDGMDAAPIKTITRVVPEDTFETVTFDMLGGDTLIGEPVSERATYWYEIVLDDQTPFCYDENGPKYFYVYPGGYGDTDGQAGGE